MKLKAIYINNFRNIKNLLYEPSDQLNIFLGENGQGKTNILEAIYVFAQGNSFRSTRDEDLMNHESDHYEIKGKYKSCLRSIEAALLFTKERAKLFKINGKKVNFNNIDRLRVVSFTPDDLYLIKGTPSLRRHFMNFALRQISAEYNQNLDDFNKLLKKRNSLLKISHEKPKAMEIVDELFCEKAAQIVIARLNYANVLNQKIQIIFKKIIPGPGSPKISYALSFAMDSGKINLDRIKYFLAKELKEKRDNEIKRGGSLYGPHRDDLHVYFEGRKARNFASQGQQRILAVCLKMAEIEAFYEVKGFHPILLLDEVLAELDEEKRGLLLEYLVGADFQTFLSSVNLNILEGKMKARINLVQAGSLLRRE